MCQIDILGRLKSQSAVRKALSELPETLDETYERILLAIPPEHREFARQTLAILAAQSDLGYDTMTAEVVLVMVARSLNLPDDNLYDVFDIRETCGCLVTFVPTPLPSYDPKTPDYSNPVSSEEVDLVMLAHYTVKEFLFAERTALNESDVSNFAFQGETVNRQWALLVLHTALSSRESDRLICMNSVEDYCLRDGCNLIWNWEHMIANFDLADTSLDFLDPAGLHHPRSLYYPILTFSWVYVPTNCRVAALAECYGHKLFLLAGFALRDLDPQQIVETPLFFSIDKKLSHSMRPGTLETCLLLFFSNLTCIKEVSSGLLHIPAAHGQLIILEHLAPAVGWESLLFAAVVEHDVTAPGTSPLEWIFDKAVVDLNSSPCRLTPLQAAVQLRDAKAAKMLLDHGADVNAVGSSAGYKMPGTALDDERAHDSPLRILRTASACDRWRASRLVDGSARNDIVMEAELERLLIDAGARDFTAAS